MTVGQRIAQKRKELGLSQEALGERLGVSRQAIYKWESGAALPEIEKLVALSKIFSVPVGWLLGVEEPEQETPRSGELTQAQLDMVEEIVRRYQQAQPAPQRRRRWPWVLAVLVLVVVLVRLFSALSNLQNDYNRLESAVSYVERSVDSQIGSIASRVEDVLERVNSFTVAHSAQIVSADLAANTVTFRLSAEPKTYTEGMTALFRAEYGSGTAETDAVWSGTQSCSAELTCPLTNEIVLSVVFLTGDRQETQKIQTYYELYMASFPMQDVSVGPLFFDVEDDVLVPRDYAVKMLSSYTVSDMPAAAMKEMRLGLFEGNRLMCWLEQLDEQPDSFMGDWDNCLFFRNSQKFTLDRSRSYCLAAVVTDEYGRDIVCADIPMVFRTTDSEGNGDWTYTSDGVPSSDPAEWEY